ncbi:hypothetical protein DdX_12527 [Ditylenchus destructor]|uniref:Uncharacterized protein n=1 Tax=Ditylenchus destructor TaxID=166010 RepID=A0AAD4QX74_9BILA|nr:hypothetical protein DdX_12527 [Ditylenchus destructor]
MHSFLLVFLFVGLTCATESIEIRDLYNVSLNDQLLTYNVSQDMEDSQLDGCGGTGLTCQQDSDCCSNGDGTSPVCTNNQCCQTGTLCILKF